MLRPAPVDAITPPAASPVSSARRGMTTRAAEGATAWTMRPGRIVVSALKICGPSARSYFSVVTTGLPSADQSNMDPSYSAALRFPRISLAMNQAPAAMCPVLQ